jgi:F0F1-type ATP synthase membrane subunit b/b'
MDGVSRGKLVAAGYKIFRERDVHPVFGGGEVKYEIREMSDRGQWVLYGQYPTKAARERTWKELAKDEKHMMEGGPGYSTENTEETMTEGIQQAGTVAEIEETIKARYEYKLNETQREHEYMILKASADASIKGAAMRENLERLLRVMFLRETKERLKVSGNWSRYCQETGIDIKNADYEIDKLGSFRDDFLVSFGSHVKYDINKIKYLTTGDTGKCSEKLGVTVQDGEIFVKGERVPCTPEDMQAVVETLQQDLVRQEEEAKKEKDGLEKANKETAKALKKAEKELKKIRREAEKQGVSPEEIAFVQTMEEVKKSFDEIIVRIDDAGSDAGAESTPRMAATAKSVIDYMRQRLEQVWVRENHIELKTSEG